MNPRRLRPFLVTLVIAALVITGLTAIARAQSAPAAVSGKAAQTGSGFTFQGQLQDGGNPVNATCDIQAGLWDAASGGVQVGGTQTVSDVTVADGRFTVTLNTGGEFSADAFTGQTRWLQIAVRCPAGTGSFSTLQPRQPLTAAPYAQSLLPGAVISGSVGTGTNAMLSLSNYDPNGVGLRIADASLDGLFIDHARRYGVHIISAEQAGVVVQNSFFGYRVDSADTGFQVSQATNVGVKVRRSPVGLFVQDASSAGVWVEDTASDGINVTNAGEEGFSVWSSRNAFWAQNATADGLYVQSAGYNGIDVTGANLAGFFGGAVQITGGCTGCLLANFGINTGQTPLEPGDVVVLTGSQLSRVDSTPMLLEVAQASGNGAVVGVVMGRAEEVTLENPRPNELGTRLIPREGAARPGDYVTIVTYGLAPVRVRTANTSLTIGQRLTAGENGMAHALQTVEVNGVTLDEAAATLGIALEAGDTDGDGLVWVLVNPN